MKIFFPGFRKHVKHQKDQKDEHSKLWIQDSFTNKGRNKTIIARRSIAVKAESILVEKKKKRSEIPIHKNR